MPSSNTSIIIQGIQDNINDAVKLWLSDPDAAELLGVISKALKAKGTGQEVLVKIPTPKGLGDYISKQMENLPMLLQMGGQAGGGF